MPSRDDDARRDRERLDRWDVLRDEAHRLLKQTRKQEASIRSLERALEQERARTDELQAEVERMRASRLWRRARRATLPPAREPPATPAESPRDVVQRWLLLESDDPAVVLAIDPEHSRRADVLSMWATTALQLDVERQVAFGLPPALVPSPVPAAFAGVRRARTRVFYALGATDGALRWLVPSQQEGWTTIVDLDERTALGPQERYLALHADVVVTGSEEAAARLASTLGRRVGVAPNDAVAYASLHADEKPPSRVLLGDA